MSVNTTASTNMEKWIISLNSTGIVFTDGTSYSNSTTLNISPYKQLISVFGLDITEEQLAKLDELYNSNDEANKMVSAFMFKHLLTERLK